MKIIFIFLSIFLSVASANAQIVSESGEEKKTVLEIAQEYKKVSNKEKFLLKYINSSNETVLSWVAEELGNFNTPGSIAALEKLLKHKQKNRLMNPVASIARESLEKIKCVPDVNRVKEVEIKNLTNEHYEIIKKLALGSNEFGRKFILDFLCRQVEKEPNIVMPLLVEYFPYKKRAKYYILKYPKIDIQASIKKGLESQNPDIIVGSIQLIGATKNIELIPKIVNFVFADRDKVANAEIILSVYTTLEMLGDEVLPFLRNILYSRNTLAQLDTIGGISRIGTKKALRVLRDYHKNYKFSVFEKNEDILKELEKNISILGQKLK